MNAQGKNVRQLTVLPAIIAFVISACGPASLIGSNNDNVKKDPDPSGDYSAQISGTGSITAGSGFLISATLNDVEPEHGLIQMNLGASSPNGTWQFFSDQALQNQVTTLNFDVNNTTRNFYVRGTVANQTLNVTLSDNIASASENFSVRAANPHHALIDVTSNNITTATSVAGRVRVFDVHDNIVEWFSGSVTITTGETNANCSGRTSHQHTFNTNDQGEYNFSGTNLGYCDDGSGKQLSASVSSLPSVQSQNFSVNAGPVTKYAVNGSTGGPTFTNLSYNATALDQYDNVNFDYDQVAIFEKNNGNGWSSFASNAQFNNGQISFIGQFPTAGSWNVRARQASNSSINGTQNNITIGVSNYIFVTQIPAGPHKLGNSQFPELVPVTVRVYDAASPTVEVNYTGTITLSSADQSVNGVALPAFNNAHQRTVNVNFSSLGQVAVQATGNNGFGNPTVTQTIPGDPVSANIAGLGSQAFVNFNATVATFDVYSNPVTRSLSINLRAANGLSGFNLNRNSNASSGIANFNNIRYTSVATGTTKAFFGSRELQSVNVTTSPGPINSIAFDSGNPSSLQLGQTGNFAIRFRDEGQNLTTVSGGSASLTSSPTNMIQQKVGQGFANANSFTFSNVQALNQSNGTIRATVQVGANTYTTGNQNFAVTAGNPTQIVWKTLPNNWIAGTAGSIAVELRGADNQPAAIPAGTSVQISFSAQLGNRNPQVNSATSVATTSNVVFNQAQTGLVVTASVPSLPGISSISRTINIAPGAAQNVAMTLSHNVRNEDEVFNVNFDVRDSNNNLVPVNAAYEIQLQNGAVVSNGSMTIADGGSKTHMMSLANHGSYNLRVRILNINSNLQSIQINQVPTALVWTVAQNSYQAGSIFSLTAQVRDADGDVYVQAAQGDTIQFSASRELPSTSSALTSNGSATWENISVSSAGTITFTADFPGVPSIVHSANITAGGLAVIAVTTSPAQINMGSPFSVNMQFFDSNNNPVNVTSSGQIREGSTVRSSFNVSNSSSHTHQMTLNFPGPRTFYVRVAGVDSPDFSVNVAQVPVLIRPVVGQWINPFVWMGDVYSVSVEVLDANSNPVSGRNIIMTTNANGLSQRQATTNAQGQATFGGIQFLSRQDNVFVEFKDSVNTSLKISRPRMTVGELGRDLAVHSFAPTTVAGPQYPIAKGDTLLAKVGFPLNIDLFDTPRGPIPMTRVIAFWNHDVNTHSAPQHIGKVFSHMYKTPGTATIRATAGFDGIDPAQIDIPVLVVGDLPAQRTYWVSEDRGSDSHPGSQAQPFRSLNKVISQYNTECSGLGPAECPFKVIIEPALNPNFKYTTSNYFNLKTNYFEFLSAPGATSPVKVHYTKSLGSNGNLIGLFHSQENVNIDYFRIAGKFELTGKYVGLNNNQEVGQPLITLFGGSHHVIAGDAADDIYIDNFYAAYMTQKENAPSNGRNSIGFINVKFSNDFVLAPIQTGGYHFVLKGCKFLDGESVSGDRVYLYGANRSKIMGNLFLAGTIFSQPNFLMKGIIIAPSVTSPTNGYANAFIEIVENHFMGQSYAFKIGSVGGLDSQSIYEVSVQRNFFYNRDTNSGSNLVHGMIFEGYSDQVHIVNNVFNYSSGNGEAYIGIKLEKAGYNSTQGNGRTNVWHNSFLMQAVGGTNAVTALRSNHQNHNLIEFKTNSISYPGNHNDHNGHNVRTGVLHFLNAPINSVDDGRNLTHHPQFADVYRMVNNNYSDGEWQLAGKGGANITNTDPKYAAPALAHPGSLFPHNITAGIGLSPLIDVLTELQKKAPIDHTRTRIRLWGPGGDIGAFETTDESTPTNGGDPVGGGSGEEQPGLHDTLRNTADRDVTHIEVEASQIE